MYVGKSQPRLDAYDKVTGRARYTDDLCPKDALVACAVHAQFANGLVKSFDLTEALQVPGVVRIVTCFESPSCRYDTGNHPWAYDPEYQGALTQQILTQRVRYYGDLIAAVVARDELSAKKAARLVKVEYEEYKPLLTVEDAMADNGVPIHEEYPGNVFAHSGFEVGDYKAAIEEEGLTRIEGWYKVPAVKHLQLEPTTCYAYMENGRLVIYSPTQTPHPHRRVIGTALGIPWGDIRFIKPCVGGGFGNREDCLYEPLLALLVMKTGGRCVRMCVSREEDIATTRTRHEITFHMISHVRKDGTIAARRMEAWANKGAYGHHGHAIVCKASTGFKMLYRADAISADLYTVFTNTQTSGAMRGYGAPQGVFATEVHTDDICKAMGFDPLEFRRRNMMMVGDKDDFQCLYNYTDSLRQCFDLAVERTDYENKKQAYSGQTGPVRKGIGISAFWYNTGAWPFLLEASTNRMWMNQDGSIQVQSPEIEFGQGTDTVFAQMAADVLHMPIEKIHMVHTQDTDTVGFGSGAYASRQTYVGGAGIYATAQELKKKILTYAAKLTNIDAAKLDIEDGELILKDTETVELPTMEELAWNAYYDLEDQCIPTAELTTQVKSNALSLGCCIAEVTVDMKTGRIDVDNMLNVHDCGTVINPVLAEGQVLGGMSMGIGYALSEKLRINEKTGQLLNSNMLDYKLPSAADHTGRMEAAFVENPEPTNPFGTKALGEPPVVPVAPAIRNAILQATGVAFDELPIDPQTALLRFRKEGLA